jgi:hypothetical protein
VKGLWFLTPWKYQSTSRAFGSPGIGVSADNIVHTPVWSDHISPVQANIISVSSQLKCQNPSEMTHLPSFTLHASRAGLDPPSFGHSQFFKSQIGSLLLTKRSVPYVNGSRDVQQVLIFDEIVILRRNVVVGHTTTPSFQAWRLAALAARRTICPKLVRLTACTVPPLSRLGFH